MRSRFLIIVFIFISTVSHAQTAIQMEEYGGVLRVPCSINGVKLKFIFDTGASRVTMSKTMADFLLDNGYLDITDFIGSGQSTVADGTTVGHTTVNIRDIEVAGMHITNVLAAVLESQSAPLLLGLSAINKLGPVRIDGNILIIENAMQDYSNEEISHSKLQIQKSMMSGDYVTAKRLLETLKASNLFERMQDDFCSPYSDLALCYWRLEEWDNIISLYEEWQKLCDRTNDDRTALNIPAADAFQYGQKNYRHAIALRQSQINNAIDKLNDPDYIPMYSFLSENFYKNGICYELLKETENSNKCFQAAIAYYAKEMEYPIEDVTKGKVTDSFIAQCYLQLGFLYYDGIHVLSQNSQMQIYLFLSAMCGSNDALQTIKDGGVYDIYVQFKKKVRK